MGKHSSLGPIDPQVNAIPAHGIIGEFNRVFQEMSANQAAIPLWQPIIAKYNPTLIGECEKALQWSNEMVREWLATGMFAGNDNAAVMVENIITELGNHALTLSHGRHISINRAREMGLQVSALEDDDELQEAVLSVHHACIQTLEGTPAIKIIENHKGVAFIKNVQIVAQLA
ncbi:MAG: hypothetical protein ACYC2T_08235 [Bacillota bacterium]